MQWREMSCTDVASKVRVSNCTGCMVTVVPSRPNGSCYLMMQSLVNSSSYAEYASPAACGILSTAWFMDRVREYHPNAIGRIVALQMRCEPTVFRHLCQVIRHGFPL